MSSLGQTLRQAREAKGLTQSQVASQTRILVQIIDDIENEDFHRIAAPIYGRGFVRLYAECVDLDSQPLIREFMDIYEGRRAPTVLVRDIPTAPTPPPAPAAVPESAPGELFQPSEPEHIPELEQIPEPEPIPEPVQVSEPQPLPEPIFPPVMDVQAPETPLPEPPPPAPEVFPEPPPPAPEVSPEPIIDLPQPIHPETEIPPQQQPFFASSSAFTESSADVRGLDLFDQAAGIPQEPIAPFTEQAPTETPPPPAAEVSESPFLPPIYEDNAPSAADRFKSGISSVSHGVLRSVRKIPRSAWRKAMLALVVVSVLAVLVFGCVKLYQMTASAPSDACPDGSCEYNPKAQAGESAKPVPAKETKETAKAPAAPQQKTSTNKTAPKTAPAPKAPGKIHSTGQKVAPLYID